MEKTIPPAKGGKGGIYNILYYAHVLFTQAAVIQQIFFIRDYFANHSRLFHGCFTHFSRVEMNANGSQLG